MNNESVILVFTGFPKKLLTSGAQGVEKELEKVSVVVDVIGIPLGLDASNGKPRRVKGELGVGMEDAYHLIGVCRIREVGD